MLTTKTVDLKFHKPITANSLAFRSMATDTRPFTKHRIDFLFTTVEDAVF